MVGQDLFRDLTRKERLTVDKDTSGYTASSAKKPRGAVMEENSCLSGGIPRKQALDLSYSIRRHFVDEFHFRQASTINAGSVVLDLGGNRIGKRGLFDIGRYSCTVIYANVSTEKKPDVKADASLLPFPDQKFDAVICSEILEHVPDPKLVLGEVFRVLRPNGSILICVPFLVQIHGDPEDYGRYTDYYWKETLAAIGFSSIKVERQGGYWCVLVEMLRYLVYRRTVHWGKNRSWLIRPLCFSVGLLKILAVNHDAKASQRGDSTLTGFTTGFGIRAVKE
jgi:SAM-dependent methyltransferase